MALAGRTFAAGSAYRYGFNGQEKSVQSGEGLNTAMFWEYDSRLGRRWNIDPRPTVGVSSYSVFNNNPISNLDIDGDSITPISTKTKALEQIDGYSKTTSPSAFPNIARGALLDELKQIVNNPNLLSQSGTGSCGPAAASNLFAEYDPVGFVSSIINLYDCGSDTRNGVTFEIPEVFRKEAANILRPVEFLMFTAMTNSGNGGLLFNPNRGYKSAHAQLSAFTWPASFTNELKFAGLPEKSLSGGVSADMAYKLINFANYSSGTVAALVDGQAFGLNMDYSPGQSIWGSHYLRITNVAEIRKKDATFAYEVTYWCWGMGTPKKLPVPLTYDQLNSSVKQAWYINP